MAMTDDDVVMDGNEDDVEMNQEEIPIESNCDDTNTQNNSNNDDQNNESKPPTITQPNSTEDISNTDNNITNDKNPKNNAQKSLENKINEAISIIPNKLEECSKPMFYLSLLLIIEVKNIFTKDKIDYLLLFNFLTNLNEFKKFNHFTFGEEILKISKDLFIKIFSDKTDFNIDKISQIYDILSSNNTQAIVNTFRENFDKINLEQTWNKIEKCATELATNNNIICNEGQIEEKKDNNNCPKMKNESWKNFAIGDKIDCRDKWGKWYYSEIKKYKNITDKISEDEFKKMDKKQRKQKDKLNNLEAICVNYIGWDEKYNEWIFIEDGLFCNCNDDGDDEICWDDDHRLSGGKTQSEYKNKRKRIRDKPEPIKYKIKDFNKLVKYINKTYSAPKGHNRTGIGAVRYADAQINGPGGNLTKFILWDKQQKYERFHHSHYDWWMFPNDRDSWGQGKKYALFQKDIDDLLLVDGYEENYKLGARLVLKSWGWDMDNMCFIQNGTSAQKWTGYNVRLLKMLYSTIILKQWNVYQSVYKFCIGVLQKGSQFRSEPMMYEYLGLEKPKYVRRWGW